MKKNSERKVLAPASPKQAAFLRALGDDDPSSADIVLFGGEHCASKPKTPL